MKSFLAFTLLVASCTAQFPTTRTDDHNNNNNDLMYGDDKFDLLNRNQYEGPYASQFYGLPSMMMMRTRGQLVQNDDRIAATTTTRRRMTTLMEMEKLIRLNRLLRAIQLSNNYPEQVQQQLPQQQQQEYLTLGQLLRMDPGLLGRQTMMPTTTTMNNQPDLTVMMNRLRRPVMMPNNNHNNLLSLIWTQPRLMAMLLNSPMTMTKREQLNNLINNYNYQTAENYQITPPAIMTMMTMGPAGSGRRNNMINNFNGMPIVPPTITQYQNFDNNNNVNRMNLAVMAMMDQQNHQVPIDMTTTNGMNFGRVPIDNGRMVKTTTMFVNKPLIKEVVTDKKVQEKIIDPVMGREQIITGDVKIVDDKVIPTTPEMVTPTLVDPDEDMMMMTSEGEDKTKLVRDVMMTKKINLIKKMMRANKRFTKFNQQLQQQQQEEMDQEQTNTMMPMMPMPVKMMTSRVQVDDVENNNNNGRPKKTVDEMMTGAEETAINQMENFPPSSPPLPSFDAIRSRRQSRLTPLIQQQQQQELFNVDNIQRIPYNYNEYSTQPQIRVNPEMINRQLYQFNNLEGQQQRFMTNEPIRYTLNKRDAPPPRMMTTYTTTGENGLYSVPLTPGNTHIGTGFSVTTGGTRYTMPTTMLTDNVNNFNMNNDQTAYIGA